MLLITVCPGATTTLDRSCSRRIYWLLWINKGRCSSIPNSTLLLSEFFFCKCVCYVLDIGNVCAIDFKVMYTVWLLFSSYFVYHFPDFFGRSSAIYFRDKRLPRMSVCSSNGTSSFSCRYFIMFKIYCSREALTLWRAFLRSRTADLHSSLNHGVLCLLGLHLFLGIVAVAMSCRVEVRSEMDRSEPTSPSSSEHISAKPVQSALCNFQVIVIRSHAKHF